MKTGLKKIFVTGLIVFMPLVVTLYILLFMFNFLDGILAPLVERIFGTRIPGLGLLTTLLIILGLGIFTTHTIGRRLVEYFEGIVVKLPIVKVIYPIIKHASTAMLIREDANFKKVVLVEYPRKGIYTIGFVTSAGIKEAEEKADKELVNVFIPTSPNPTSGMLIVVSEEETIPMELSIEDAMSFIVSGGFFRRD